MMTIQQFGNDVLTALQQHLPLGKVTFRGSFASGQADEYSDVDVQADVHQELNQEFFDSLTRCLQERFGPLSVRYDPDQKENRMAQDLKITFHRFAVFWRIDLNIKSDRDCPKKWPSPFPDWSIPGSAFWNVVWAVKHGNRGKTEIADHYMFSACDKMRRPHLTYSEDNARTLLSELAAFEEVDKTLIRKLQEEMRQSAGAE